MKHKIKKGYNMVNGDTTVNDNDNSIRKYEKKK